MAPQTWSGETGAGNSIPFLTPGIAGTNFGFKPLLALTDQVSNDVKQQLALLQSKQSAVSITDMLQMQMLMNHLSQMSEMAASVVQALNTSMNSLTRGIKGG